MRRLATAADRHALARLAEACRATASGPTPAPAGLVGEVESRPGREILAWLACEDEDAEAVGFVALCSTRAGWSIPWLLVHPAARRRGLGRHLVRHAVGNARANGAAAVSADTLASWTDALSFWMAIGFQRQSRGMHDLL